MNVSIVAGQFPIVFDIRQNLHNILSIIMQSNVDELIVLPEGALSGYADDPAFLQDINLDLLEDCMQEILNKVHKKGIHLIFGSCIFQDGKWFNAGIYLSPDKRRVVYKKVNLATHERGHFASGSELPIIPIHLKNKTVKIGIQLCREIRFPEQWQYLARHDAELFIYLTNAVNSNEHIDVWRSHLVSRAAENQRFVVSANNAHSSQNCPTMIISPKGEILKEVVSDKNAILKCTISLSQVSNWYHSQSRTDLIDLKYKGGQDACLDDYQVVARNS